MQMSGPIIILRFMLVLLSSEASRAQELQYVLASTNQGWAVGATTPEAAVFKGIPYSRPPTGNHRWRDPRKPVPFQGRYWNATYYRPGCLQHCRTLEKYICPKQTSEDCLYLNIWVPKRLLTVASNSSIVDGSHYIISPKFRRRRRRSLAVMVYIHGGNFEFGAGSVLLHDSRFLASEGDIIVVTLNYRLGPFGFLVHGRGRNAARGNYAIKDQVKALEWVRDNIANFGGNPQKVTIAGESAGAESVAVLMTLPRKLNLFRGAIIQSDPFGLRFRTTATAKQLGENFAVSAGCLHPSDTNCLRRASASTLMDAYKISRLASLSWRKILSNVQPWGPTLDGHFILESPIDVFRKGNALKIPTLVGHTANEAMMFAAHWEAPLPTALYVLAVSLTFKGNSAIVLDRYPSACGIFSSCDNRHQIAKLLTDFLFICPERQSLYHMTPNSWTYVFNQSLPSQFKMDPSGLCNKESCHGGELPYLFGTAWLPSISLSPGFKDDALSSRMQSYWSNFVKFSNPNERPRKGENCGTLAWPRFSSSNGASYRVIQLNGDGDFVMSSPYQQQCNFWDKLRVY